MLWALMIVAMFVSIMVGLACFFLKVKNFPLVLTLQFFASFGATYGLAYAFAGSLNQAGMDSVLQTCAGISLFIVILNMIFRHYLGSWYDRRPGPGMKQG